MEVRDAALEPLGYQKITGLSAVQTPTVPLRCRSVIMKCETQSLRWTDHGVDPDPATDVGFLLDAGEEFQYTGKVARLRFKEEAASSVLHLNFYA